MRTFDLLRLFEFRLLVLDDLNLICVLDGRGLASYL